MREWNGLETTARWPSLSRCFSDRIGAMAPLDEGHPDFGRLFDPHSEGSDDESGPSPWITPRTAEALYTALLMLADSLYDDVELLAGRPAIAPNLPTLYSIPDYPGFTWRQPWDWWRQAARSYDDLAADLRRGQVPFARCPGEEIAILKAIETADDLVEDAILEEQVEQWPAHARDYDWGMVRSECLEDLDMLLVMDPRNAGTQHPLEDLDANSDLGNYNAEHWFLPWQNLDPDEHPDRDPGRGFRRPAATDLPGPR